ncbi:MAG: ABC transporter substrate-binding protein [Desulfobacterales bacterium]|nr:ABC transporter substrate-binding protein [Desulfobacterales bacterium]
MTRKIFVGLIITAIAGIVGFWIFHNPKQSEKSVELEKINVKLKFFHLAQFAGNYVAVEKNYYTLEGLDVNLIPYSSEEPPIDAVVNGKSVFGITGANNLIIARAKGLPIKSIGVIYKINPICAYTLKTSGITNPYDFIGKTVGLENAADIHMLYSVMMAKLGIDRSRITEKAIGWDAAELLNRTTDVSTGYIANEPYYAIKAGHEVNVMLFADYGADMYADVIFATEETINNNPKLVERFLRATLKGWKYAIKNLEEAVDMTLKYSGRTKNVETYMLQQSIPLIHTGDSPVGWMKKEKWEQVQNILLTEKVLEKAINMEDVYTMQFLETIYPGEQ